MLGIHPGDGDAAPGMRQQVTGNARICVADCSTPQSC
jgi:hypothetical protein